MYSIYGDLNKYIEDNEQFSSGFSCFININLFLYTQAHTHTFEILEIVSITYFMFVSYQNLTILQSFWRTFTCNIYTIVEIIDCVCARTCQSKTISFINFDLFTTRMYVYYKHTLIWFSGK